MGGILGLSFNFISVAGASKTSVEKVQLPRSFSRSTVNVDLLNIKDSGTVNTI